MMLTKKANGLATAEPCFTTAPACQDAITQMHVQQQEPLKHWHALE